MEEHEQALELETRRLAELQLAQQFPGNQPYFGYCMDELKVSEGLLLFLFIYEKSMRRLPFYFSFFYLFYFDSLFIVFIPLP